MPRKAAKTSQTFTWRGIRCRVSHERDYLSRGWSHLELRVISPAGAPLPITTTGYLSHFLDEDELTAAGGPVALFRVWLDREACTKALADWQQLKLF
jgi:hypothetical protein